MNLLHRLADRLLLYLPLLFVGALALGSYWLVRTADPVAPPEAAPAPVSGPDYRLFAFVLRAFDAQGRLRSEVVGESALHDPQRRELQLRAPRLRSLGDDGALTTAMAQRGVVDDAQTRLELMDQAQVLRHLAPQPDTRYQGAYLMADLQGDTLRSDQPVQLSRGRDQLSAQRLHYDQRQRVLQLDGRVRAQLHPQPGAAAGGQGSRP
ncbi:MAG: LPS export ABC transporter periplasmic protein LptC [Rhodoferax sp.]